MIADVVLADGFVTAGEPNDFAASFDAVKASGVDEVIIHMQMGGIGHHRIMESIEMILRDLVPAYR